MDQHFTKKILVHSNQLVKVVIMDIINNQNNQIFKVDMVNKAEMVNNQGIVITMDMMTTNIQKAISLLPKRHNYINNNIKWI